MKFLIDVPPPTISGLLHMGHVFSYCHMDFIARWQTLKFRNSRSETLTNNNEWMQTNLVYPFCFDCNGLPTEKLAQKDLKNLHLNKNEIIQHAEKISQMYKDLFQGIGMSWSNHTFHTFDDNAIKIAELSFEDLKNKGYAFKEEREYFWCPKHQVSVSQSEIDEKGIYERSGEKVEIRKGEGWFINLLDHLPRIRQTIDSIDWHPIVFKERLHHWLDTLKFDWSISRERNYGIHIPGEPENIVFDTWFTSSLSPQLAWASETKTPSLECPIFDARFQAHDIIRTWALFTIVKSLYHNDQKPWKKIIISGHALDKNGKKISKSAGNFIAPSTYLEKYGMSGVRYWAALNQIGTDTRCDESQMDKGKKLLNKIRNARKFLEMGKEKGGINKEYESQANLIIEKIDKHMDDYDWPSAIWLLTDFFWHTFCDKWIEGCKKDPCYISMDCIMEKLSSRFSIFL